MYDIIGIWNGGRYKKNIHGDKKYIKNKKKNLPFFQALASEICEYSN